MERFSIAIACLLVLITIAGSAPMSCPTVEDLRPCTCKRMAFGLHVICAKFNDTNDLVKAFRVLRDYKVQNVLLHGLKMTDVLPNDIFDGLEISELRVEESKLKFSEPAFSGLDESLHILNVAQHTMIKSSENFSIARLHKLSELNIKKNRLTAVKNMWLKGKIPNVKNVRLEDDEIEEIESEAFADLHNLEVISIQENRIKVVERSMFPDPANELRKIYLSGNEIKTLPYDFFFRMPKLREVYLTSNDITTLPEITWKSIWEQLHVLMLFENSLVCDDRMNWLKNLRWPAHVTANCVAPPGKVGMSLQDFYKT